MTLEDIILRAKNVGLDKIVRQSDIKTQEDIEELTQQGYQILCTSDEFSKKYSIPVNMVCYSPSISLFMFYFNEETLAVFPLHSIQFPSLNKKFDINTLYHAIDEREEEVKNGDYFNSLITLADTAMVLDYFSLLLKKENVKDLYGLFLEFYTINDYGFGNLLLETLKQIVDRKTDKQKCETVKKIQNLPDVITIYRGENNNSTQYTRAYSWTLDINIANFFAARHGNGPARIIEGKIKKSDIIEYLDGRGEKEILVYPENVEIINVMDMEDYDYLQENLDIVLSRYHQYREKLLSLKFYRESEQHGKLHEARVLMLCLLLADKLSLPSSDMTALSMAAIYHDTQRKNDGEDTEHGKYACEYYVKNERNVDDTVKFLIEYHCRPDVDGYEEIKRNRKLSKNRSRNMLLFKVFKDADALDRVRFGIKDLDIRKLRLQESKSFSLVANLLLKGIRL